MSNIEICIGIGPYKVKGEIIRMTYRGPSYDAPMYRPPTDTLVGKFKVLCLGREVGEMQCNQMLYPGVPLDNTELKRTIAHIVSEVLIEMDKPKYTEHGKAIIQEQELQRSTAFCGPRLAAPAQRARL